MDDEHEDRFASGREHVREIDIVLKLMKQAEERTVCSLGDAAAQPT